eukprot:TRINITY_DN3794_c0_g1_i3.p1 TRINITY_DN3794_c0_g1~~TRINITY_DN3794_c0_g1_i3.p1  ORF type:complete len:127 (-),score=24.85 TRINITY_DN3794_c0_g1_i3:160-540(-)
MIQVTSKKSAIIASHEELVKRLGDGASINRATGEVLSKHYSLFPVDLRDLKSLDAAFDRAKLDTRAPTLVIAECVLIYMDPETSQNLVRWAAEKLTTAAYVIYEQKTIFWEFQLSHVDGRVNFRCL